MVVGRQRLAMRQAPMQRPMQWTLFVLWWLGCWLVLTAAGAVVAMIAIPQGYDAALIASGPLIATTIVILNISRNFDRTRRRFASGRLNVVSTPARKVAFGAFVGQLAGPVIVYCAGLLMQQLFEPPGYNQVQQQTVVVVNLCAGFWLGAFTWEVIGSAHRGRKAAAHCMVGGLGALMLMALMFAVFVDSSSDGSPAVLVGTLPTLSGSIVWASILIVVAHVLYGDPRSR